MSLLNNLSDAALTFLCSQNGTVDPNQCPCLLSGGGPELNTDVSGPGVRFSFYLQALFLALLASRSGSLEEISGALYTLIATNVSMAITSLILGFKAKRGMSLHDAIIVFYLLSGSWLAIFLSLPSYNRFVKSDTTLQVLIVVHSYVIFAFILAVLITAHTFGKTPRCNSHAVGVIFYHFPALNAGRIVALVFVSLVVCIYTFLSISDYYRVAVDQYRKHKKRQKDKIEKTVKEEATRASSSPNIPATLELVLRRHTPDLEHAIGIPPQAHLGPHQTDRNVRVDDTARTRTPGRSGTKKKKNLKERYYTKPKGAERRSEVHDIGVFNTGIFGSLLVEIIVIVILWSLFVINTELLILWNRFDGGGDGLGSDSWGFGQILPMFLVLLPFVQLMKAFHRWGLRRRKHRSHSHVRSDQEKAFRRARAQHHDFMHGQGQAHSHAFEHSNGPGRRPGRSGTGMGRMPSFFFGPPAHPYGGQTTAHISEISVHSSHSIPNGRISQNADREHRSRDISTSSESSSSFTSSESSSSDAVANQRPSIDKNDENPTNSRHNLGHPA